MKGEGAFLNNEPSENKLLVWDISELFSNTISTADVIVHCVTINFSRNILHHRVNSLRKPKIRMIYDNKMGINIRQMPSDMLQPNVCLSTTTMCINYKAASSEGSEPLGITNCENM
jgi:hypothetical protein